MPQIYFNSTETGFVTLWKTDESLEWCRETALRLQVVFPRGWELWKNTIKQKQALLARIICMQQLGTGEIFYEQNGKPFLSCGRLSISHSPHFLAVYFDRCYEIGIDVEEPHTRIEKIASRFMHENEKPFLTGIPKLTAGWAIKESVYKKYGGKTAFFSENIIIQPFELEEGWFEAPADVHTEAGVLRQNVKISCTNEYILAHTLHV